MKLKILVAISLFLFFTTVVSIVTAGLILSQLKKEAEGKGSENNFNNSQSSETGNSENVSLVLSTEEVSKHSNSTDCWIVIENKVYNVTGFLSSHPGGAGLITTYCGKDATAAFKTKDKNPSVNHSQFAAGLLNNYYLGTIGETLKGEPVARILPVPTTVPAAPKTTKPINQNVVPTQAPQNQSQNQNVSLTAGEVASHNTLQNCWIIVSGQVYDVTSYIVSHPGGASAITNTCGTDATNAFQTRGGRGSNHSQTAYSLLSNYLVGSLGSSVSVNAPSSGTSGTSGSGQNTQTNPTTTPSNSGSSGSLPSGVQAKYPGATIKKQSIEDDGRRELEIIYNGSCIKVKTNSSGQITDEESC